MVNESKIKSEIIQNLLFSNIELLSRQFDEYIEVNCDMANDCEMYIYLDSKNDGDDFFNLDMYELYLEDFENECSRFIDRIESKLPMKHLEFVSNYHIHHKRYDDGREFYDSCQLHFRIIEIFEEKYGFR